MGYIEGLFICAFCKTYFDRHFEFLSGKDPQFGNSYGQTMRLYIEHAAVMHEEVELMVGNWDNNESVHTSRNSTKQSISCLSLVIQHVETRPSFLSAPRHFSKSTSSHLRSTCSRSCVRTLCLSI